MDYTHHELMGYQNGQKLIVKLAHEKGFKAVENLWLMPEYQGEIIYGLALAGNVELVNRLISMSPDLPHLHLSSAKGYAEGKIEQGINAMQESKEPNLQKALIFGYAKAGNVPNFLCQLRKNPDAYGQIVLEGLIRGGQIELLNSRCGLLVSKYLNHAIETAAEVGRVSVVDGLLQRADVMSSSWGCALTGYSRGRCFGQLGALLRRGLDPMLILTTISKGTSIDPSDTKALLEALQDNDIQQNIRDMLITHFGEDSLPATHSTMP